MFGNKGIYLLKKHASNKITEWAYNNESLPIKNLCSATKDAITGKCTALTILSHMFFIFTNEKQNKSNEHRKKKIIKSQNKEQIIESVNKVCSVKRLMKNKRKGMHNSLSGLKEETQSHII